MRKEVFILTMFSFLFVVVLIVCNNNLQNTPAAVVNKNIGLISKNYHDPSAFYTDDFLIRIYGNDLVDSLNQSGAAIEEKNVLFLDFMKELAALSYGFPHVTENEKYSIEFLLPSLPNYNITLIQIKEDNYLVFDDVEGDLSLILAALNKEEDF